MLWSWTAFNFEYKHKLLGHVKFSLYFEKVKKRKVSLRVIYLKANKKTWEIP